MKPTQKPTFILGVGAQKSGTSWLYAQLARQDTVDLGFRKEYHIWDAVFLPHFDSFLANPKWYSKGAAKLGSRRHANTLKCLQMQTEDGAYANYFKSRIHGNVNTTGDITPSYSGLDASHFTKIRNELEEAGFAVKVVFIMRDPVARNWSACLMRQRIVARSGRHIDDDALLNMFDEFYKLQRSLDHTLYDKTVINLRSAFDESDIHFGIYENLFDETSLKRLGHFLQRDLTVFDASEKVNTSKKLALPEAKRNACRDFYASVYDFCHVEFPETKTLWRSAK
ncbi:MULTISPECIES: hypothetical protein [Rhodobacterales]|uniref:hypothetical protein n=1 Tax=Rhodobacterales TaxID=204455 RepID=UPI0011BE8C5C|nr:MULTISPECIES: hypothetical protein [Rhodobacterales]MDO6591594.1 hypothetical protein [Yoonia sp. 1_MG-2023]